MEKFFPKNKMTNEKTEFEKGLAIGRKEVLDKLNKLIKNYGRSNLVRKTEIEELLGEFKDEKNI